MAGISKGSYCIWVRNHSGLRASYALVAAPPHIEPPIDPIDVSTKIICTFRNVPSGDGIVRFEIPKQIHAVCGTTLYDRSDSGAVLEIFHQRPVTCAYHLDSNSVDPGTCLRMTAEERQPAFLDDDDAEQVRLGAFTLKTNSDFTFAEAKSNGYILGLCGPWNSTRARGKIGVYTTFTPKPCTTYYVQPKETFGLLLGDFKTRSKFNRNIGDICELDFAKLGSDTIEVVHTERNELLVQTDRIAGREVTL